MILFYESEISEMPGLTSTLPVTGEVVKQQPLLTFVKVYQQAAIRCMGLYYPAMWWLQWTLMQAMQNNKCNSFCRKDFENCSFGWVVCSPWFVDADMPKWSIFPRTFSPNPSTPVNKQILPELMPTQSI